MSDTNQTAVKNLRIWDQVSEVDELYTSSFSTPSGWVGTSINPTYLAKRATETFGPMGSGWGLRVMDEKYVDGAPLREGVLAKIHVLRVQLWYMLDGKECHVEQYGQTTFVGEGSFGIFTDEEAPKKSMTDAMTKCLSLLGFASDIYMGLFDDKHSQNPKTAKTQAHKAKASGEQVQGEAKEGVSPELKQVLDAISRADSARLITARKTLKARFPDEKDSDLITKAIAEREKKIALPA